MIKNCNASAQTGQNILIMKDNFYFKLMIIFPCSYNF